MKDTNHIITKADSFKFWKTIPYLLGLLTFLLAINLVYFKYDYIKSYVDDLVSKNLNLKIDHIYLTGIKHSNINSINETINLKKGDPLFSAKPAIIRKKLEELPWVRLAKVQRILPNKLKIQIFEHKAIATIMFNNQRWALNSKGELIDIVDNSFNYLLELSGTKAKENAAVFFSLFSNWTDLLFFCKQAEFIGERRWNLYLENGTVILLPEENVRYALEVLKVLNNQQRVLKKDKIKIDLRNVEKHIIIDEKSNIV